MSPALAEISFSFGDRGLDESTWAGLILLGSFLLSFALIRISTRLMRSPKVPWWPGSIQTAGGLHVHHLVFGIVMMLLFGFLAIALPHSSPWLELIAAGFGVGAGLTLDEYALWLHLKDVYWAEEGRRSVDAVIVAAVVAALILVGARPLSGSDTSSTVGIVLAIVVVLALSLAALLKGRVLLGTLGLIFPPLSMIAIVRLADPSSPWARWWYGPDSRRMRRATARFERRARRVRRWQDRIGGAPSVFSALGSSGAAVGDGPPEAPAGGAPAAGLPNEPAGDLADERTDGPPPTSTSGETADVGAG